MICPSLSALTDVLKTCTPKGVSMSDTPTTKSGRLAIWLLEKYAALAMFLGKVFRG